MCDCNCNHDDQHSHENALVPIRGKVIKIVQETPDTKTFHISTMDDQKPFDPQPGQLGMLSLPSVGEGMFSVTNKGENHIEMGIKAVGELTNALHEIEVGQEVGIRGPYGNGFPLEHCKGKDLLFIGGGIGLAPVRSLIMHCIRNRADYGKLTVVYGARSKADLCFKDDLFNNWPKVENMDLFVTIDRAEEGWDGHVGFVPTYVEELGFSATGYRTLRPADHDQIHFADSAKDRFSGERHYYNFGNAHEMRRRQMRTLQYRFQICLSGRSGIYLGRAQGFAA